jgi:hypothetical protein
MLKNKLYNIDHEEDGWNKIVGANGTGIDQWAISFSQMMILKRQKQ